MPYPPMKSTTILLPFPSDYPAILKQTAIEKLKSINNLIEQFLQEKKDLLFTEFLDALKIDEPTYMAAVRSGISRPTVFLQRKLKDAYINAFNPVIAELWRANMDIQFILDAYACSKYCAAYVSKSCRGMSELLKEVVEEVKSNNFSALEKLRKLGNVFLNGIEVCSQEASYSVLGIPLSNFSRDSVFINTGPPNERVVITKSKKELEKLPPDSTDILVTSLLEHYVQRPQNMESMVLAEFASQWTFSKKRKSKKGIEETHLEQTDYPVENFETSEFTNDIYPLLDGSGFIKKRTKNRIIRFCNYGKLTDPQNYYRENVMLYFPWRDEKEDIINADCQEKYLKNLIAIENVRKAFDKKIVLPEPELGNNEKTEKKGDKYFVDEEFEIFQQCNSENFDFNNLDEKDKPRAEKLKMPFFMNDKDYENLIKSLNKKQSYYHDNVIKQVQEGAQFFHFVTGGAGVGKSMLISAITQSIMREAAKNPGKNPTRITVILCAPTGIAAFNIDGVTIHQAFFLPFSQFNGVMPRLSEDTRNRLACEMQDVKLIIIDEISMTSMEQLFQINDRLKQIKRSTEDFGGISVLAVGDFNQLEPVMAKHIFSEPTKGHQILGYNHLWPKFQYYELNECMRQKNDIPFAQALNRVAGGICTEEDIKMFKSCETITKKIPESFDAIRLMFCNEEVRMYNEKSLASMSTEGIISHANDKVQGQGKFEHFEAIRAAAKLLPCKKTQNLPLQINFKVGAKYMMTVNLDTSDGLVNGSIGILRGIEYGTTKTGDKVPVLCWFEFKKDVGHKAREKSQKKLHHYVPITRESRTIHSWPGRDLEVVRSQFPFTCAMAITIHKSQGSTFENVVLSPQYRTSTGKLRQIPRRALYVGLSRCTSLKGLFIDGTFEAPTTPKQDDKIIIEMEKLKKRPVVFHKSVEPLKCSAGLSQTSDSNFEKSMISETSQTSKKRQTNKNKKANHEVLITVQSQGVQIDFNHSNTFFRVGSFTGSKRDLGSLHKKMWLTDSIMNAIGFSLTRNSNNSAFLIDSLFMENSSLFHPSLVPNAGFANLYIFLNPGKLAQLK